MRHPRSSIRAEIGWLLYFVAIFVAMVYLLVVFLVPHHFNDKVAIGLAGLFAGLVLIATRAFVTARSQSR